MTWLEKVEQARPLAEFMNIGSDSEAEDFRCRYPDFFPPRWWTYKADEEGDLGGLPLTFSWRVGKQWQLTQRQLYEIWGRQPGESGRRPSPFEMVNLLLFVFDPADIMTPNGEKPARAHPTQLPDNSPYHDTLSFLSEQPWRMKRCPCFEFFIANNGKALYCNSTQGEVCRAAKQAMNERKRKTWRAKRDEYNQRRRVKYRKNSTTPGKSRRRI